MHKTFKEKNKKIGILTYHFPYNYGAMLQAYALQKAINHISKCEIIDYEPDYHTKQYVPRIKNYISLKSAANPIAALKSSIFGLYGYFKDNNHIKKHNFESFKKLLKKSKKLITITDLKKELCHYDIVIVGSDQIWKKSQNYNFEYFLSFEDLNLKKYSYAASAGSCFPVEDLSLIIPLLIDFECVSVREKALADQLTEFGINCQIDLDPTLLLKKEDYIKIEKKKKVKNKYIFVYFCHDDRAIAPLKHLSETLNAEIIFGPYVSFKTKIDFEYKLWDYLSPQEFLYCIHHACLIVTSSFHCTVFSILYNKPFIVFDGVGAFERIKNLLEFTDLTSHIFKSEDSIDFSYDYENAIKSIVSSAKSSYDYLNRIVNSSCQIN